MLFLRAYHYFLLTQYFGDVILMTAPLEDASEAFGLTRTPSEEVYQQIITDLEGAVTVLPLKSDYDAANIGRASKGAALALLGKVYLTQKNYPSARQTLEQILNMDYSLLADYAQVFEPTNKNHAESIFEVQYQGGNNLGEWSSFIYTFAPRDSEGAVVGFPTARPQGWNIPTNDMIAAYETGDIRKDVSLKEGYTNSAGTYIPIPYINKYNHPHTIVGRTDDNWPILRYADVLLMLAEAINEEVGPDQAYTHINQVRDRAGLSPLSGLTKESFRVAIAHERRVELAFENHRWFDLKRTLSSEQLVQQLTAHGARERANPTVTRGGVPFAASDYRFEGYEALFPIPDRQIFLSNKLTQNDGY
ncbi:RagB/SusD family nutrient uptake outer membrane protein [Sphingobacterium corticis]|uniref:RagB/SusD family nutrient uptake outer membrane protein n=1 Tax=Sphingobacterium corticis TaxID=1812823 RepID=A0ABW5NLL4_9SPHI